MATHFSRQNLEKWIANGERAWLDSDREKRVAQQQCRWCWYARTSDIAGQAFTDRTCGHCQVPQTYATTATNPLCQPCAKELGLCVRCCADIDLAKRAKLERSVVKRRKGTAK